MRSDSSCLRSNRRSTARSLSEYIELRELFSAPSCEPMPAKGSVMASASPQRASTSVPARSGPPVSAPRRAAPSGRRAPPRLPRHRCHGPAEPRMRGVRQKAGLACSDRGRGIRGCSRRTEDGRHRDTDVVVFVSGHVGDVWVAMLLTDKGGLLRESVVVARGVHGVESETQALRAPARPVHRWRRPVTLAGRSSSLGRW